MMNAPTDTHLRALDAARQRMRAAKEGMTRAAEAIGRREQGADELANAAIAELAAARRELNALLDEEPANPWAEAARINNEESDA